MKARAMKPETLERRARERAAAVIERRLELRRRLAEKAKADPAGPWAELLAEAH